MIECFCKSQHVVVDVLHSKKMIIYVYKYIHIYTHTVYKLQPLCIVNSVLIMGWK